MTLLFIRIFFIILCSYTGFFIAQTFFGEELVVNITGAGTGFVFGILLVIFEEIMKKISIRNLSAAVFGLMFGLFMAWIMNTAIKLIPMDPQLYSAIQVVVTLVFCYLGMVIALRGKNEFNLIIPYVKFSRQDQRDEIIILDTSVIIDGRIADMCKTEFISGRFVVPRFVLRELQEIADSEDELKRNRGRRGLDMLSKMQKNPTVAVRIHDEDFPELKDVDAKLIKLARVLGAKIFTNDYNLNKIAQLQGIKVLNINELANSLKQVVLPGESLEIRIIKEGKEMNQGVGYLEDGTMVVVDNTRHLIGQLIKVVVTSVLQTQAGRMIFARLDVPPYTPHKRQRGSYGRS